MQGSGGLSCLKKEATAPDVHIYPFNHQSGVLEYINTNFSDKPIQVKTGRIEVETKEAQAQDKKEPAMV